MLISEKGKVCCFCKRCLVKAPALAGNEGHCPSEKPEKVLLGTSEGQMKKGKGEALIALLLFRLPP